MSKNNKKIIFWGTPDFTIDFLNLLYENDYTPVIVITNPDRKSGRGMKTNSPIPKKWASEKDIKILQPETIDKNFYNELKKEEYDLSIVIAYGKIIPEDIINIPKFGTINVHYSNLPKYRGATPVESAILNGDLQTGISIQKMRYKLDSGPIIASEMLDIDSNDTTPILRDKLNNITKQIFIKTIDNIFNETITPKEQDETKSTFCKKIKKEDGEINFEDSSLTNYRKYKAYFGSIGTYFFLERNNKKTKIKINKASFEKNQFVIEEVTPENSRKIKYDLFLKSI